MANTTRALAPLPAMPKRGGRTATPQACECGCDGRTAGGRFIPGHDARRLGWATRIARGFATTGMTKGEEKAARAFLADDGGAQATKLRAEMDAATPKAAKTPRKPKAPKADPIATPDQPTA